MLVAYILYLHRNMKWEIIESDEALTNAINKSQQKPVVFFKHSNRCSISVAAKDRFERFYNKNPKNDTEYFYIDVVANRAQSLKLAEITGITHESPQVLVLHRSKVLYHQSHMGIDYNEAVSMVAK